MELPPEVREEILLRTSLEETLALCATDTNFRSTCQSPSFWRAKFFNEGIHPPPREDQENYLSWMGMYRMWHRAGKRISSLVDREEVLSLPLGTLIFPQALYLPFLTEKETKRYWLDARKYRRELSRLQSKVSALRKSETRGDERQKMLVHQALYITEYDIRSLGKEPILVVVYSPYGSGAYLGNKRYPITVNDIRNLLARLYYFGVLSPP